MSSVVARFEKSLFQRVVAKHQQNAFGSGKMIFGSSSRDFSDEGPKKRISKVKKKEKKTKGETGRSRDLELLLAFLVRLGGAMRGVDFFISPHWSSVHCGKIISKRCPQCK